MQLFDGRRSRLQYRLGELDLDTPGGQVILSEQLLDAVHESVIQQLSRRDVHCDPGLRPCTAMPVGGRLNCGTKYPIADLDDQSGFLCDGQELPGRYIAAVRHAPAQERFDQNGLQAVHTDFRLEEQLELAALDGPPQTLLDGELG
jgi:hypothetical protein